MAAGVMRVKELVNGDRDLEQSPYYPLASFNGSDLLNRLPLAVVPQSGPSETIVTVTGDLRSLSSQIKLSFGACFVSLSPTTTQSGLTNFTAFVPAFERTSWPIRKVPLHLFFANERGQWIDSIYLGNFYIENQDDDPGHLSLDSSRDLHSMPGMQQQGGLRGLQGTYQNQGAYGTNSVSSSTYTTPNLYTSSFPSNLSPSYPLSSASYLMYPSSSNNLAQAPVTTDAALFQYYTQNHSQLNSNANNATNIARLGQSVGSSRSIGTLGSAMSAVVQSQPSHISKSGFSSTTADLPPPLKKSKHMESDSDDENHSNETSKFSMLKFHEDPSAIIENWSSDEKRFGRKLVRFWNDPQMGVVCWSIVAENSIWTESQTRSVTDGSHFAVISCLYWDQLNQYFFTSVDCLLLIESLAGRAFAVEEKNRIRRNLEKYQPQTVSKNKPICTQFFLKLMSFPKPKPRNIEKDVKVFRWSVLPEALSRILSRYAPYEDGVLKTQSFRTELDDLPSRTKRTKKSVKTEATVLHQPQTDESRLASMNFSLPIPNANNSSSSIMSNLPNQNRP